MIGVAVGGRYEAILAPPDDEGGHGDPAESAPELLVVEIGRSPADSRGQGQGLVAHQLLGDGGGAVRVHRQGELGVGIAEQEPPQIVVLSPVAALGHHEDVRDGRARHVKPRRVHEDESADARGMTDGELGGDPAAQTGADQVHGLQAEGVEQIQVVEDQVLDPVDVAASARGRAPRMGRGEDPERSGQRFVKGLRVGHRPVHIGQPVQVEERRAVSALVEQHGLAGELQRARLAHRTASRRSSSGNSSAKSRAESCRSSGMTCVAKSRWLLRVRS